MKNVVDIFDNFIIIKRPIFVSYNREEVIDFFNQMLEYFNNGYKCFYAENGEPINNDYIKNLQIISDIFTSNNINPNKFVILYENNSESHKKFLKNLGFEYALHIRWITDATPKEFVDNQFLSNNLDKKFLFLNRKFKNHRLELYQYLKNENILNNTYYSAKWLNDSNFEEDYESEKVRLRVDVHDHLFELYNQSYIHIITETKCEDVIENIDVSFFSEKTFRHLAFNRPFIMVAEKNHIKTLQSLGFKTFHPYIDESYDVLDYNERMKKIKQIIIDLNKKSKEELFELCKNCENIFEHNRLHLIEISKSIQSNIKERYPYALQTINKLITNYNFI